MTRVIRGLENKPLREITRKALQWQGWSEGWRTSPRRKGWRNMVFQVQRSQGGGYDSALHIPGGISNGRKDQWKKGQISLLALKAEVDPIARNCKRRDSIWTSGEKIPENEGSSAVEHIAERWWTLPDWRTSRRGSTNTSWRCSGRILCFRSRLVNH